MFCFVCQSVERLMLILVVPSVLDALCVSHPAYLGAESALVPVNLSMIYLQIYFHFRG